MNALLKLACLCLCLAVAGCGGGGNRIEAIYTLSALDSPPVPSGTSAQILVPEPRALSSLATEKIAVKPTALTLSYYPAVALEDTAPKVFQRVLLDTYQNTGRVAAVGLPGESLLINYQIVTEMRAFQAETFEANRARVVIAVKLLNDANGRVLRDRIFTTVVPMGGDAADDAAEGLEAAAQQIATDIVAWTLAAI
ncbi:MAG: ABC-type transport auxiliary lipoprotein family protein [Pseudomonadota bacterium]